MGAVHEKAYADDLRGSADCRLTRIHEVTRDFRLEDVWELPGWGGADAFPRLVRLIASMDPSHAVRDPVEGREAARLGPTGRQGCRLGFCAPPRRIVRSGAWISIARRASEATSGG
jgi:hypothetical protein